MSLPPTVYLLIIGGILGFFIGYVIKKNIKTLSISLGVLLLALISLDAIGAVVLHEGIVELMSKLVDPVQMMEMLMPIVIYLPLVGSFVAGCIVGLAKTPH